MQIRALPEGGISSGDHGRGVAVADHVGRGASRLAPA